MIYDTHRLMVAYFANDEVVTSSRGYRVLPEHMVIAPWFYGEINLVGMVLDGVAKRYTKPITAATGAKLPVGDNEWGREVCTTEENELNQLHRAVAEGLGKVCLKFEDPSFKFRPIITKPEGRPGIGYSEDLSINHLAIIQDLEDGRRAVVDSVPLEEG